MKKHINPEAKSYQELPEEEKSNFKPINERGDFVTSTAEDNPEVAHRLALAENEAFGQLQENVSGFDLSTEEIINKLSDKSIGYDEKKQLQENLFQIADLARLKGEAIDDDLKEVLNKNYTSLSYSKLLSNVLVKSVEVGDIEVIGRLFLDEKIYDTYELRKKITNNDERQNVFEICKTRTKSACEIISQVDDLDLALQLYREAKKVADLKSYSAESDLKSTGQGLGQKLFEAGRIDELIDLVEQGVFEISFYKKFIHHLGEKPELLLDLAVRSRSVEDICYVLKFIADKILLEKLINTKGDVFINLPSDKIEKILEYCNRIIQALDNKPQVLALSELLPNRANQYSRQMEAVNKFVVGINEANQYCIGFGNMDYKEYHRGLFESLNSRLNSHRLDFQSGGYLKLDEIDGKVILTMERNSGDYGFYSREVMEHFKQDLEKELQKNFPDKEIELKIDLSSGF